MYDLRMKFGQIGNLSGERFIEQRTGRGSSWPGFVISSTSSSSPSSPATGGGGPASLSSSSSILAGTSLVDGGTIHPGSNQTKSFSPPSMVPLMSSSSKAIHCRWMQRRHGLINDSTTNLIDEDSNAEEEEEPPKNGSRSPSRFVGGSRREAESLELSMVLEKAQVLLTSEEFASFNVYLSEYEGRVISIEIFASYLLRLLADENKASFFTELRELVRSEDLSVFDKLTFQRSCSLLIRPTFRPSGFHQRWAGSSSVSGDVNRSLLKSRNQTDGSVSDFDDLNVRMRSLNNRFSEDAPFPPRHESIYQNPRFFHSLINPSACQYRHEGYPPRHRVVVISDDDDVQEGEDRRVEFLPHNAPSSGANSIHPLPRDNIRELRQSSSYEGQTIRVPKHSPTLGIAIEGGVNTKQPLPRIIAIQPNGAAFLTGGLRVGQLIKEVDGINLSGLPHEAVARLIAERYAKRDEPHITLVVNHQKLTPAEQRRSCLFPQSS